MTEFIAEMTKQLLELAEVYELRSMAHFSEDGVDVH